MRLIGYPHGLRIDKVRRNVHLIFCQLDTLYADPLHHLFSLKREDAQLTYFTQSKKMDDMFLF